MEIHIEMREKMINFLAENPDDFKSWGDIKDALGLKPLKPNGHFEKAMKTHRVDVLHTHPAVHEGEKVVGYLSHPVRSFRISKLEIQRRAKRAVRDSNCACAV